MRGASVALALLMPIAPAAAGDAISRHCLPCHAAGGCAPIKLDSAEGVRRHAKLAALLVEDGTMPPALDLAGRSTSRRSLDSEERAEVLAALRAPEHAASRGERPRVHAQRADLAVASAWTISARGGAQLRTFVAATEARRASGLRWSDPGELANAPIRGISLAPDARKVMRRLDAADDEPGIESMGNVGNVPSGALGALTRVSAEFVLPAGFHFDVPEGDIAIEVLAEPIGRPAPVAPRIDWIEAPAGPSRAVRAAALPVVDLALDPGACEVRSLEQRFPSDVDLVAVIVKGGAFLRAVTVTVTAAGDGAASRLVDVPDFRMAFNEPWIMREPVLVRAGEPVTVRFGFDNTEENPQQPSRPPQVVHGGLPPLGEDSIAVLLYAERGSAARKASP